MRFVRLIMNILPTLLGLNVRHVARGTLFQLVALKFNILKELKYATH